MDEENQDTTAPAPSKAGQGALGRLQGLFGVRRVPGQSNGLPGGGGFGSIQILIGGKTKMIIPAIIITTMIIAAFLMIVSSIAVYASRLGSVPGYGGTASEGGGSCPSTIGYLVTNDTFDTTGSQIGVTSVPDISQATLTETSDIAVTVYCPTRTGPKDPMEGGQTTSFGIRPGIGNIAVPNDPNRFPLGRTVIDIPGIGLRVATDHGSAITASPAGSRFDVDLMVGYALYGTSNCNQYSSRWVTNTPGGSNHVLSGAKVYVFKNWGEGSAGEKEARKYVETYDNNAACQAAQTTASSIPSGSIVIDPGHNSNYNSFSYAIDGINNEGDHNWLIATKVRDLLTAQGYKVALTKNEAGANISLPARVKLANDSKATLFVSLHSNAQGGPGPIGIVYCSGIAGNGKVDYSNDTCASSPAGQQSRAISHAIVSKMASGLGLSNTRYWGGDLGVLTGLKMPAALIEMFAHDNSGDLGKISGNEDALAKAIAEGIASVVKK